MPTGNFMSIDFNYYRNGKCVPCVYVVKSVFSLIICYKGHTIICTN